MKLETPSCNFCHSSQSKKLMEVQDYFYRVDAGPFEIVQCKKCHLVYLSPRPTAEDIAKAYPDSYLWTIASEHCPPTADLNDKLSAYYFRRLSRRRARWVSRLKGVDKSARVLDVGCGRGGFLMALRELGFEKIAGTELTPPPVDFPVFSDFSEVSLKTTEPFDIITLWHVLEHLHDPSAALRHIHHLLKPGGRLILGTQNFDSLSRKLMGARWPLMDCPRHLFHFTRETLGAYLKDTGFQLEKEWKLTEFFPVLGGHLFSHLLMREDHHLRLLPGLMACAVLSPVEIISALLGQGCILTVLAFKK